MTFNSKVHIITNKPFVTQLAGAVEYADYFYRGVRPPTTTTNKCPRYDTKPSDDGSPVLDL